MRWKVLEKKLVFSWIAKVWKVRLVFEKFNHQFSETCNWYFIEKNPAVGAVLFDKKLQKLLLVKQFRLVAEFLPKDKYNIWPLEIVAGSTHKNESPKKAIIRECYEETGLNIKKFTKITHIYPSPAIFGEKVTLYYAQFNSKGLTLKPKGLAKENEDIMPQLISLKKAFSMVKKGQISDAKTVVAILWLQTQMQKK